MRNITRRLNAVSALALLFAICAPAEANPFNVNGSGTLSSGNLIGVTGESITFNFTYDDSLFGPPTGSAAFPNYTSLVPIAVNVVGSVSGALIVDPVTVANPNDFTFDQWNFKSGINGLVQANNAGGAAFTQPFPNDFSIINALFVNQVNTTGLWVPSNNVSFGLDYLSPGQTLGIGQATWTVAPVPIPAAIWLFGSALGLLSLKRFSIA
jgi:hypothetical protein